MAKNNTNLIIRCARAHGGAASAQLLADAGVSATSIRRRVSSGELSVPFRGIYIAESIRVEDSILFAAALAYPEGAVCRFSAANRLGFQIRRPDAQQFVVAQGAGVRTTDLRMHETRDLPEVDVVGVDGLHTTSPSRTLCDLSAFLKPGHLRHLLETQLSAGSPTEDEIVACVQSRRRCGVKGVGWMAEMLGSMLDDEPFPESMLELRLFEGLRSVGLGDLVRQFIPDWYDGVRGIVDAADPIGRTIVEADGRRFRQVTQAHDNDRRRDRKAAAHGFLVLRVGYRELEQRRHAVLSEIKDIVLARRPAVQAA